MGYMKRPTLEGQGLSLNHHSPPFSSSIKCRKAEETDMDAYSKKISKNLSQSEQDLRYLSHIAVDGKLGQLGWVQAKREVQASGLSKVSPASQRQTDVQGSSVHCPGG